MITELTKHLAYKSIRPYKGGFEIRLHNLDDGRTSAERIIRDKKLPLVIFDIDVQLRSIAVREIKKG